VEHTLPAEDPARVDSIEPTDEVIAVPAFHTVSMPEFVKSCISLDDLRKDPTLSGIR